MKMELRYLRQDRFVRVMRKANSPPNMMATTQVPTASSTVLMSGIHRLLMARRLVKRSM